MTRYGGRCNMPVFEMGLLRLLRWSVLLMVGLLVLSACTATVRDTRYLSAVQGPPLKVPAGMDTPNYNAQMQVQAPVGSYSGEVDNSFAPIRPPQLDDAE